jgi:hypothetical protein
MVRTRPLLIYHFQLTSTHRIWGNYLSDLKFLPLRTQTVQEFSIVATSRPTQPYSRPALLVSGSSCLLLNITRIVPRSLICRRERRPVGRESRGRFGKIDQQDVLPHTPLPAPFIAE